MKLTYNLYDWLEGNNKLIFHRPQPRTTNSGYRLLAGCLSFAWRHDLTSWIDGRLWAENCAVAVSNTSFFLFRLLRDMFDSACYVNKFVHIYTSARKLCYAAYCHPRTTRLSTVAVMLLASTEIPPFLWADCSVTSWSGRGRSACVRRKTWPFGGRQSYWMACCFIHQTEFCYGRWRVKLTCGCCSCNLCRLLKLIWPNVPRLRVLCLLH